MYIALLCSLLAVASAQATLHGSRPNIIHIVADDLGHNDLAFKNGDRTYSPNLDKLAMNGILLDNHYAFKVCSPTRTMIQMGRYTFKYGYYSNNDANGPNGGIPPDATIMPADLKRAGYSTHAIGKWHCGFRVKEQTATFRGYDSYLGYSHAEENYFTQTFGAKSNPTNAACNGTQCCGIDFLSGDEPSKIAPSPDNGTYSTYQYISRTESIIRQHAAKDDGTPFFIYLALQNVHGPTEAPPRFFDRFANVKGYRQKIAACLAAADEGVGNITALLNELGLMNNTLIVFHSDNGGDVGGNGQGMNNYPTRGGKWTFWEGGVRVIAFIGGGFVPPALRNTIWFGLSHVTDWRASYAALAGVEPATDKYGGMDGYDILSAIWQGNSTGPRLEVVHSVIKPPYNNVTCDAGQGGEQNNHVLCGAALRAGDWKLVLGYAGWPDLVFPLPHDDGTGGLSEPPIDPHDPTLPCFANCLFNLASDPQETTDVKHEFPDIYNNLIKRHDFYAAQGIDRLFVPGQDPRMCQIVEKTGYWQPYQN